MRVVPDTPLYELGSLAPNRRKETKLTKHIRIVYYKVQKGLKKELESGLESIQTLAHYRISLICTCFLFFFFLWRLTSASPVLLYILLVQSLRKKSLSLFQVQIPRKWFSLALPESQAQWVGLIAPNRVRLCAICLQDNPTVSSSVC